MNGRYFLKVIISEIISLLEFLKLNSFYLLRIIQFQKNKKIYKFSLQN